MPGNDKIVVQALQQRDLNVTQVTERQHTKVYF